ncbi:MAG: helix-turn-helix domain-containing protein [Proteobacteria bacterium]|nr:helix-turn-helix domain-containing protein [Pseudomonadota bacterium]
MSSKFSLSKKKLSSNNAKLYKSLGALLKEYRQWREISQEKLAESIRISVRELQNWEANRRRARIENLHDLSELTGIPMQALVALNADQPIWYSLRKRFFTYSLIENTQFSSHELFTSGKKSEDQTLIKTVTITTEKQIDMILSCHRDLYGTNSYLQKDVIRAATAIVPDLNIILFDYWGHYVAHRICLPVKMSVYQELKKQKSLENYLTSEMISDIITQGEGVLFLYSTFSTNVSTAYRLTSGDVRVLSRINPKEKYVIASHTVTKESAIIQKNLDMSFVRDFAHIHDEVCPVIYETKLDFLLRPDGPFGWLIEPVADKPTSKKVYRQRQKKRTPVISAKNPDELNHPGKGRQPSKLTDKRLPVIVDISPLIVDKNGQKKHPGEKKCIKSKTEVCTNPKCTFYTEKGKDNIVSNGTYQTKEGTLRRRFLCRECGKSFCSRTETLFYDIRSSEEKVLNAIIFLVKGMSVQGVAKLLGVKFETIRRWLDVAAAHSDKINKMLINEPDISLTELDNLWTFVKTNTLRQRARFAKMGNKPHIIE